MGVDRNAILHNAQLFASRGQFDAAIGEWKKLSAESPTDGSIFNTIGDLHLKRNSTAEAITAFLQAAAAFRSEGATLKAIAAYKKVLKVDPSRYEVYRHLGDLNAERGLLSSAVQDYLTLGKYYLKERKTKDALDVYRKIVSQDPSNLDVQQRVAELCLQENLQEEAVKTYLQLGRERSAQQRYEEAKEAYLAVLRIDPKNSEAAQFVENFGKSAPQTASGPRPDGTQSMGASKVSKPLNMLAEATRRMEGGQYAGAEAILSQLLTREPGNPQVCRLLARLHLLRGDLKVALGEYRFLAGAALRAQDYSLAESLISEYLQVEPNCVALLELLGELSVEQGDVATAVVHLGKAVEVLLQQPEPGMPSLPADLYEKITQLAPNSSVAAKLASHFEASGPPAQEGDAAAAASTQQGTPSAATLSLIQSAAPDDIWNATSKINFKQDRHFGGDKTGSAQPAKPAEAGTSQADVVPLAGLAKTSLEQVRALIAKGLSLKAEETLTRFLRDQPDHTEARQLLGQLYEEGGDGPSAALHYAKALDLLLEDPSQRDSPLPAELYHKIKTLAPASPIVGRLAAQFNQQDGREGQPAAAKPATPGPDECEAHYALGVAFKNMGLYDDAKEEFEVAIQGADYFIDSSLMLALCLKEQGRAQLAMTQLERLLDDPRCNGQRGQIIRYELGLLYESAGFIEQAAQTYETLPSFHDAPRRLESLRAKGQVAKTD